MRTKVGKKKKSPQGMVVSDFDGTIFPHGGGFHRRDLATLERLGGEGFIRVIATGRSMESLYRAVDRDFPVDYVVFSSGAGVFDMRRNELLRRTVFSAADTVDISRRLMDLQVDFMVHHPIPDNHYFHYYSAGTENPDFYHRIDVYRDFAAEFNWAEVGELEATQFVIVLPPDSRLCEKMAEYFYDISVIQTTSPLDMTSRWVELFPEGAHKGNGVAWLAEEKEVPPERVMVVGNDFNDIHMLEWAEHPFVVANAPPELKSRFETVPPCSEAGFSTAVAVWMQRLGSGTGKEKS